MNLALPAPQVEEALASPIVECVEPATAEMARPSHSIMKNMIQPPPIVEPATIVTNNKNNNDDDDDDDTSREVSSNPSPLPSKPVPPLSVEGLRMTPGINHFESEVAILPRAPSKNIIQLVLPCLYDDRPFVSYGEAKKYCFIKDTICYVYNDRMDPKPLYQIALQRDSTNTINSKIMFSVVMEDRYHPNRYSTTISPQPNTNLSRPEMKTVLLFQTTTKTNNTPQLLYQFTYDTSVVEDSTVADRFLSIVQSIISLPPSKNECLGEK